MVFIQERRFYLEQFLRKLTRFQFIIEAPEFQTFARPQSGVNIEKSLNNMGLLPTSQLYERCKTAMEVNDAMYDLTEKEQFAQRLTEFTFFVKKIEPYLKYLKNELAQFLTTKQLTINNYKNLARMWNIYEEVNLTAYVDMSATSLVLNNPANSAIKDQLVTTSDKMKNPFVDVFHWTKGQVLDLQAISAAVAARQTIAKKEMELVAKKQSTQSNLDNLNAGKTTMGTLFKNSGDAGSLANTVEQTEREIVQMSQLKDLVTIYLGEKIIPTFKREKLELYGQVTQQFHVLEINNASSVANFWSTLLQNPMVRQASNE